MRLTPGTGSDIDLDRVDLFDLDLYTSGDPHSVWDVMRAKAPLHHQVLPSGREFWSVTRYEDVCRVLGAVIGEHSFDSTRPRIASERLYSRIRNDPDAVACVLSLVEGRDLLACNPVHHPIGHLENGDIKTELARRRGNLETDVAAADDDESLPGAEVRPDTLDVRHRP